MDDLTIAIGKILIDGLEKNREFQITYKQLGEKLNPPMPPRSMDNKLGFLSSLCKDLGLPLISVVVVNKETNMPGDGFFKEFFVTANKNDFEEIYITEINKILSCKGWTLLKQTLGLI